MPNLMESMASGSTAVRTMAQNMYGGQYDQQNAAAAAQEQQLRLQQEQANIAKTTLENNVKQEDFVQNQEAISKLRALAQSPDYVQAKPAEQARMISQLQATLGRAESAESSMKNAEALDLADLNKQIKTADTHSRQIQSAVSVLENLPDDKVKEAVDNLPKEAKEALINSIGKANYANMDGKAIKQTAASLMWSASGKLAEAKIEAMQKLALARQTALDNYHNRQLLIAEARLLRGTSNTGSKLAETKWKDYRSSSIALEKNFAASVKELDKKIESQTVVANKSKPMFQEFFGRGQTKEQKALEDLQAERLKLQKDYLKEKRIMAKKSGDEDEISLVDDLWNEQFGEEDLPPDTPPSTASKPSTAKPATTAPSNKREAVGKVVDLSKPGAEDKKKSSYTPQQQTWIDKAKQMNPGMSEEDIIKEGKKKGKL